MWTLSRYLKPYWKAAVLAPLFMVLEVCMDLLQPLLMAGIINDGVMKGDLALIQRSGAIMVGIALIGLIGGAGCTVFAAIASMRFGADVRNELFEKVQAYSYRNLDRFTSGSLVTRLTNDVVQVQNLVQMTLRILVRAPLLAIGSLVMALAISPQLGLILIIVIPILFAVQYVLIKHSFPLFAKVQQKLDRVNTVLQENFTGIRVVKAFVREHYENSRFGQANSAYTDVAIRAARAIALNMPIMSLILNGSIVAVLWFGGVRTQSGGMPVGDLVAFINYVTQVLSSLLMVGMIVMNISRAKVSADRINEALAAQPDIVDAAGARTDAIREGRVEFDRVSLSYADSGDGRTDEAVSDISLIAEPGQTVAILGTTGSGKSTLVSLIPRLYDVTRGAVRIDGVNVKDIGLRHLRGRIGVVLQESILFTGTIRDNIRFGKSDAGQEEVETAARAAQAHDFIALMPDGYDTLVGQRGVNLSGGQKQRISIARALLMRPAVLILDDSTSAVDLGTESRIQQALKELMRTSTCFVIAQRISSVLDADKIVVLEEGRIVAQGTHGELMRTSAEYREIYRSQLGKEEAVYG